MKAERPDTVVVQGDTITTLCGALAAFYNKVPVGHVEAGLRTGDFQAPFPEEMNRVLIARMTNLHFAPTETAARNLENEGVERTRIFMTGNSESTPYSTSRPAWRREPCGVAIGHNSMPRKN